MAKSKDATIPPNILAYLQTKKRATMYDIGKFLGKKASNVKPYLESMVKQNLLTEEQVVEHGQAKRYFSIISDTPVIPQIENDKLNPISLPKELNDPFMTFETLLNYYRRIETAFAYIQEVKESDDVKLRKKGESAWELFIEGVGNSLDIPSNSENEILMTLEQEHNASTNTLQVLTTFFKNLKGEEVLDE